MNQTGVTPESFKGGRNSFAQIFRKVAAGEIVPPTKTVRTCALSTDGWCTKTASPAVVAAAALLQPLLAELCAFYDEHVRLWNTAELLREKLKTILPKLNEKELYILQNRLLTDDPVTLREIGERYNVTRERVRQLEARLLEKIRQHLALDIKDFSDAWIQ